MFSELHHFLDELFVRLLQDGIDVGDLYLDHVCYRVETAFDYNAQCKLYEQSGATLLSEELVGGRWISTFKLASPIIYKDRCIEVVEIPEPKQGSDYLEGWEHAEFVLVGETLREFIDRHPQISFGKRKIDHNSNPDITVKYDGMQVKFHLRALEDVIAAEKRAA